MHTRSLHRLRRERQRKRAPVIVRIPLIVVVLVEDIAGLAIHDIQGRVVEVREVNREALGRPEVRTDLLHRLAVARQRLRAGPGATLEDGKVAPEGMLDVHAMDASPPPRRQRARRFRIVDGAFDRGGQQRVVVGVALRQPARRLMRQHVLQPHRAHEPLVLLPVVAQLWLEQQLLQLLAREVRHGRRRRVRAHGAVPIPHQVGGRLGALRCRGCVIDGVHEALGAEAIERRNNVGLDRQHVRRRELLAGIQQLVDAFRAIGRHPLDAQRVGISVGRDAPVGRGDDSRRRIVHAGKLVVRNISGPLVRVVIAGHGNRAVARRADRNQPGCLVADVPVHVGIDDILSRRAKLRERRPELLPVLRRVHGKERNARRLRVIDDPLERELALLSRNEVADDRPVPGDLDIQRSPQACPSRG